MRPGVLDKPYVRIIIDSRYRGAALMEKTEVGAYLSKFVVDRMAQGEGIGGDLWHVITRDFPTFFWRARPDNPIGPWYARNCSGMLRTDDWQVFWRDLPLSEITAAVEYARKREPDLEPQD